MSYTWMPAGYGTRGKVTIFVRIKDKVTEDFSCNVEYSDGSIQGLKYGSRSFSRVTIELPDRTLIIVEKDKFRLLDSEFDYAVNIDLYGNNSDALDVPYSLISAHNGIEGDLHHIDHRKDHRIFGDSGGAQLRFGTQPFVDPYKVIDFFNEVVDMGVSLDVAPRPIDAKYKDAVKAAATIQKRNNDIFAKYARDNLQLLNVVQGYTLEDKLNWAEEVYNPRFTGWALGSTEQDIVVRSINLTATLSKLKGDHYHFFGVGGPTNIPVLAYLGKYANNFTSDSTTYLMYGNYHKYFNFQMNGTMPLISVGRKSDFPKNKLGTLECNCSVCRAFKYCDVFNLPAGIINDLLTYHNAVAMSRYSRYWGRMARNTTIEGYLYYLRESQKLPTGRVSPRFHDMETAIKAIDTTFWDGYKKANLLYAGTRQKGSSIRVSNTFAGSKVVSTFEKNKDGIVDDEEVSGSKLDSFSTMWSAQADIMPRYLTVEEMNSFGLNSKKSPGFADWCAVEEYKIKKNLLETSNIWIAQLLHKLRKEKKIPITIKDRDILYELRIPILDFHWLYPLSNSDVDVMIKLIMESIDRIYNKSREKQAKLDSKISR